MTIRNSLFLTLSLFYSLSVSVSLEPRRALLNPTSPNSKQNKPLMLERDQAAPERCCLLFHLLKRNIMLICFTSVFFAAASFQTLGSCWVRAGEEEGTRDAA